MVVDGLEILGGDFVSHHAGLALQHHRHVPHQVFDEFGVLVGVFGDVLLVGPLEQSPKFRRGLCFDTLNEPFQIQRRRAREFQVGGDVGSVAGG